MNIEQISAELEAAGAIANLLFDALSNEEQTVSRDVLRDAAFGLENYLYRLSDALDTIDTKGA